MYTISKTYSIKTDLYDRFIRRCRELGISPSKAIRDLIKQWLESAV